MERGTNNVRVSTVMRVAYANPSLQGSGKWRLRGQTGKSIPRTWAGVVRMLLQMPERTIVSTGRDPAAKPKRN